MSTSEGSTLVTEATTASFNGGLAEAGNTGPGVTIAAPVVTAPAATAPAFSASDMEAARQQEKDKLYAKLNEVDALKAQLGTLTQEREARIAQEAQEAEAAVEAERKRAESEMTAKQLIDARTAELSAQMAELLHQNQLKDQILDRERQLNAVNDYKSQRLVEVAANIHPQLLDLVTGLTPEEIDASIAKAETKTAAILQEVEQFGQQIRQAMPGVSPAGAPPVGPMDAEMSTKTYSMEELAAMPIDEYAKHRTQLQAWSSNEYNRSRGK